MKRAIARKGGAILTAALVSGSILVLLAGPADAQATSSHDLSRDDQIVLNGRLTVPQGETVDTAVIFNGPATVEGTVTGSLVVFNGRVDVSGTVDGDVVVFRGQLVVRSGAEVHGDLVTQETPQIENGATIDGRRRNIATRWDFENIGVATRIAWWIGYSVSTLILGLLLLLLAPTLDAAILDVWSRRTGAAIGLGVLAFFLLPIGAVIFLVTIVAIPLGLFVLLALALLYTVGYTVGAHVAGRLMIKPPRSRFVAFLVGWVVLRAIALIPVAGGLVWLVAAIVGLGVLVVALRRRPTPAMLPAPPPMPI